MDHMTISQAIFTGILSGASLVIGIIVFINMIKRKKED